MVCMYVLPILTLVRGMLLRATTIMIASYNLGTSTEPVTLFISSFPSLLSSILIIAMLGLLGENHIPPYVVLPSMSNSKS
jgi:hypothetical protein